MRIAFIIPSLANKGPVIVVKNLVDYLRAKKIYCEVFYFSSIEELAFECRTTQIKILNFKVARSFDIIHTHGIRPDLYSFLMPSLRVKRVSTLHNYIRRDLKSSLGYSSFKSALFEFIWKVFLIRMDKIITLSDDAERYYRKRLFSGSIQYIYNGLPPMVNDEAVEESGELLGIKKRGLKIIGTNAILTHRKGLHQIINVLPKFPHLVFVIVGDGSERANLERLAYTLDVKDRCIFLGFKKDAKRYLKYFDYYCMPSYSEGLSLALIEAASKCKPTLLSKISVHKEIFKDDEVSFIELDDDSGMVQGIEYLIENQDSLSKKISQKYKSDFTLEAMGGNHLTMYKNLMNSIGL